MSTISELLKLLASGVVLLAANRSAMTIIVVVAFVMAGLSWYLCNNYVKLWNRRFRLTATHQFLTASASVLTFFFVLAFGGLRYMQNVTSALVGLWEAYEIKTDDQWRQETFKDAYYKVKDLDIEDFSNHPSPENGGDLVPLTKRASQEATAKIYATATCNHFDHDHPFLSKIIWSNPSQSAEKISNDVVRHFNQRPDTTYSTEQAISIAADTIKTQLSAQTPRTVTLSRIALVILYLLVMAIPLGAIGYASYKDIRIQK